MNLVNQLADRANKHPNRLALADRNTSLSYVDLYQNVCSISQALTQEGIQQGDVILLLQPVSISLYINLLGIFHAGAAVMLIDPATGTENIRHSLQIQPPRAFIGSAKAHALRIKIPEIRNVDLTYHSSGWVPCSQKLRPSDTSLFPPTSVKPEAPALITFTSGSTGRPKAASRSHGFLLAQHDALSESLHYQEGEIDLITLPVFTLANLASGLSSIIADTDLRYPASAKSKKILAQCGRHQVTRCAASPAFFKKLLDDQYFPPFQTIYTGGAPVFPPLLDQLQSLRQDMNVVTVFGSTEAEPISHIAWSDLSKEDREQMQSGKGLLVGKAVRATELKIIPNSHGQTFENLTTQAFQQLELPQGEIGEIIVSGDHVLKGYLHGTGDAENKIKLPDSTWHRTGDVGWLDTQERLWLMGRSSAVIQTPNLPPIYPFGIECVAMHQPKIQRCALLWHKEQITLFIEGAKLTETDIKALSQKLQAHYVELVIQLPHIPVDKRHNAKIDYLELKKLIV